MPVLEDNQNKETKEEIEMIKCKECGKIFKTEKAFDNHPCMKKAMTLSMDEIEKLMRERKEKREA